MTIQQKKATQPEQTHKIEQLITEIATQLREQGGKGRVWISNLSPKYGHLGTLRGFLEGRPDVFRVTPSTGKAFDVTLADEERYSKRKPSKQQAMKIKRYASLEYPGMSWTALLTPTLATARATGIGEGTQAGPREFRDHTMLGCVLLASMALVMIALVRSLRAGPFEGSQPGTGPSQGSPPGHSQWSPVRRIRCACSISLFPARRWREIFGGTGRQRGSGRSRHARASSATRRSWCSCSWPCTGPCPTAQPMAQGGATRARLSDVPKA